MIKSSKIIEVAKVGAPFGIKGWVHLRAPENSTSDFLKYSNWYIKYSKSNWLLLEKCQLRTHGNGYIIKWINCDDRTTAQSFTHAKLGIISKELPKLTEDEFYWKELEGCTVFNNKQSLGTVVTLMETPANDVLVVNGGDKEILIPFIDNVVLSVNLEAKKITVEWDAEF